MEVYRNVFLGPILDHKKPRPAINLRGGGGVIFENEFQGFMLSMSLTLERALSNRIKRSGYPGRDQVRDVWIWGNRSKDGGKVEPVFELWKSRLSPEYIKKDRDYFLKPKPGYRPLPYPHPLTRPKRR